MPGDPNFKRRKHTKRRAPRRRGLALVLAAALLAFGGCGGSDGPRWPTANELVVALESAPAHFDPRLTTDQASDRVHDILLHGLVTKDPEGNLIPDLAEGWEILDEGLRYRFHLRPGVTFHDGRALGADDVVWTLGSLLSGEVVSPKRGALGPLQEVRKIDDLTVDLLLEEPFSSLLVELTSSLGILPAGTTPEEMNRNPVGSGPFRLVDWGPDRLTFEAFEGHRDGRPPLDRVIYRVVPDATVRALELLKGSVQMVVNDLPPDLVPRFRDDPAYRVEQHPGAIYVYLGLNVEEPRLADPRLRRALAAAIDRQRIVDTLWRGLGTVTETLLPAGLWAHHPGLEPIPYDPDAARRLLDEAGFPDPDGDGPLPRLSLSYKTSTSEIAVLQAQVIQQMAAEVGIDLQIRSYEFATFYEDVRKGNFEIFSLARTGIIDPNIYRLVLHSESLPPAGQNRGRYANPEVDRLLEEAARLPTEDQRRPLYWRVQEIVAEELPYISLLMKTNFAVLPAEVQGYEGYLGGELHSLGRMRWVRSSSPPTAASPSTP